MRDYYEQARVSLRMYLERSIRLLADLENGRVTSLDKLLQLKSAAFHNFRAAETILQSSGRDITKEAEFLDLWKEIVRVDQDLEVALHMVREELQDEMVKSQRVRLNIGKYRSGLQVRSAFEKEI